MRNGELENVILNDVIGYLGMMTEIGWGRNSFLGKTVAFRKFFEYWGKQKLCQFDYTLIPIIEREYQMPKIANLADYNKLLDSIPRNNDPRHIRNRLMVMLLKDSGMRLGEMLSLNIEGLDLDNMQVIIKTEKTKKLHPIRKIFWTKETNDQLKLWLAKMKTLNRVDKEALFISATGIKQGIRLTKSGATEVMRRLSHEAKLDYVLNCHSLRHMFGHDLAQKKVNNSTISTMLGHSHVESSYVYTILNEDEMANVYKDLRG
jgi:integrase/recombinase XerC